MGARAGLFADAAEYAEATRAIRRVKAKLRKPGGKRVTWADVAQIFEAHESSLSRWAGAGGQPAKHEEQRRLIFRIARWARRVETRLAANANMDPLLVEADDPAAEGVRAVEPAEQSDVDDPARLCSHALRLAERGHPNAGFSRLVAELQMARPERLARSAALVPMIVYLGYRYLTPATYLSTIRRLVRPVLQVRKPRERCDAGVRTLAAAQVACALNEGGAAKAAGELFARKDVRALIHGSGPPGWPREQLVRNEAVYWALRERQANRGIGMARSVAGRADPSNLRAIATVECSAWWAAEDVSAAWAAIENPYRADRELLLEAAAEPAGPTRAAAAGGVLHHFSTVYNGSIMRWAAGASYPEPELRDDVFAMEAFLDRMARIPMGDETLVIPATAKPLPSELETVRRRCLRDRLGTGEIEVLTGLAEDLGQV